MKTRWLFCALLLSGAVCLAEAQNQVLELDGKGAYVQLAEIGKGKTVFLYRPWFP